MTPTESKKNLFKSDFALEFPSTISVCERHWNVPLALVNNNFYDYIAINMQNENKQFTNS